jgi:pimeloyl-ACP methyl ester carboxylesterase
VNEVASRLTGRLVTDAPLAHQRFEAPGGAHGPLVVLLHGIGGGRLGWPSAGQALADAGCVALAVDQPGYGLSPPLEPFTLEGVAERVRALIAWCGAKAAVIVGHSMGGMVAQELAAAAPQCVRALVLASTSPAFGPPGGGWQQQFLRSRFAPLDAGRGMAGLADELVPSMVSSAAGARGIDAARALMAGVPEATYRAALSALVRFDRRDALPRIAAPTLVVTGDEDRTASPELARKMALRIAGAKLAVLPNTGHLAMLENPAAFEAALLAFLETLP